MIFFDHFYFFRKFKAGIKQNIFAPFFYFKRVFPDEEIPSFLQNEQNVFILIQSSCVH